MGLVVLGLGILIVFYLFITGPLGKMANSQTPTYSCESTASLRVCFQPWVLLLGSLLKRVQCTIQYITSRRVRRYSQTPIELWIYGLIQRLLSFNLGSFCLAVLYTLSSSSACLYWNSPKMAYSQTPIELWIYGLITTLHSTLGPFVWQCCTLYPVVQPVFELS